MILTRSKQNVVHILGVRINLVTIAGALSQIEDWIKAKQRNYICACPNYSIIMGQKDNEFREALNGSSMSVPDGMSVVWVCRLRGYKKAKQVRGTELMLQTCKMAAEKGYSCFFYGGADGIPERLGEELKRRVPGFRVAGTYSPPFRTLTEQEIGDVINMINAANPDILWVGLGAPKQEIWMAQHIRHLNVPVMVGVGAAFDFVSGNKEEVPGWLQRAGLEWLFRLIKEPRRLWKRNLYHPIFMIKALLQKRLH